MAGFGRWPSSANDNNKWLTANPKCEKKIKTVANEEKEMAKNGKSEKKSHVILYDMSWAEVGGPSNGRCSLLSNQHWRSDSSLIGRESDHVLNTCARKISLCLAKWSYVFFVFIFLLLFLSYCIFVWFVIFVFVVAFSYFHLALFFIAFNLFFFCFAIFLFFFTVFSFAVFWCSDFFVLSHYLLFQFAVGFSSLLCFVLQGHGRSWEQGNRVEYYGRLP